MPEGSCCPCQAGLQAGSAGGLGSGRGPCCGKLQGIAAGDETQARQPVSRDKDTLPCPRPRQSALTGHTESPWAPAGSRFLFSCMLGFSTLALKTGFLIPSNPNL